MCNVWLKVYVGCLKVSNVNHVWFTLYFAPMEPGWTIRWLKADLRLHGSLNDSSTSSRLQLLLCLAPELLVKCVLTISSWCAELTFLILSLSWAL